MNMKISKKSLIMIASLMMTAAMSVFGTVAYLADTATVQNTFTVGNVDITLDESQVNPDGTFVGTDVNDNKTIEQSEANRVTENNYKIVPGKEYTKDPTVTVKKGSEECFVRMLVTFNNADVLTEALGSDKTLPEHFGIELNEGWDIKDGVKSEGGKTITYECRYYKARVSAVDADVKLTLFDEITVPGALTQAQLKKLSDFKITVVAQAIQTETFDDADLAWKAFDDAGYAGTEYSADDNNEGGEGGEEGGEEDEI